MKRSTMGTILFVGNTRSTLNLDRVRAAERMGYRVHWYSYTARQIPGIPVYSPPGQRMAKIRSLIEMAYVWRLIKRTRPQVIHVLYAYHSYVNLVLARFRPLVVTVMGGDILPDQCFRTVKYKFLTRHLLRRAEVITSKSGFLDDVLLRMGCSRKRLRRITWGVDTSRFKPGVITTDLRRKLAIEEDASVFLSVRGGEKFYRHHRIIRAFSRLLETEPRPLILLVCTEYGSPAYIDYLKKLVQNLGMSMRVRFLPPVANTDMPQYYNLAVAAISVPISDGMPHSLYESMACGCFHILADLPQYRELIRHRQNGLLVNADSVDAVVDAMRWTLTHPRQLEHAARVNRLKVMEIADKNEQEENMMTIYQSLIRQPGRGN